MIYYKGASIALIVFCVLFGSGLQPASALETGIKNTAVGKKQDSRSRKQFASATCNTITSAAQRHKLPPNFLARLIWQESRFNPNAVSPKGAQGIAQFMPETAALWGLDDPFDADAALVKSAQYLSWLRNKLGNLGLAAAGYNAGSKRVTDWQAGNNFMPLETRNFVYDITGRAVDDWNTTTAQFEIPPIIKGKDFKSGCIQLASRKHPMSRPRRVRVKRQRRRDQWGVNIAQAHSVAAAMVAFKRAQQKYPNLLGKHKPRLVKLKLGGRGNRTMKIVQVPAQSQRAALSLCRKLLSRGGTCLARSY